MVSYGGRNAAGIASYNPILVGGQLLYEIPCRATSRAISVQVYQLQNLGTQTDCCDGYAVSPEDNLCERKGLAAIAWNTVEQSHSICQPVGQVMKSCLTAT